MKVQCPKCKRIQVNGKFVQMDKVHLVPGLHYQLCPECRYFINRILSYI